MGSPFIGSSGRTSLRQGNFRYHFWRISSRAFSESSSVTAAHLGGAKSSEMTTAPTFSASNQETMTSSCRESETRQFVYLVLVTPCLFVKEPSRMMTPLTLSSLPPAATRRSPMVSFWYFTPYLSRTFFAITVLEHPVSLSDFIRKMVLPVSGRAKW